MKKLILTVIVIAMFIGAVNAQSKDAGGEFKSFGKPFVKIFTNYHSSFYDGENANVFEISRAYFGYEYNFSKEFSGKLTLDVGNPGTGSLQQTAYLKTAYLQYNKNRLSCRATLPFLRICFLQFAQKAPIC